MSNQDLIRGCAFHWLVMSVKSAYIWSLLPFFLPLACWRGLDCTTPWVPDSSDCFLMVSLICSFPPCISPNLAVSSKGLISGGQHLGQEYFMAGAVCLFCRAPPRTEVMSDCPAVPDGRFGSWVKVATTTCIVGPRFSLYGSSGLWR